MGFRTSSCDESLFLKGEGEKLVLFLIYVDGILLFSSSMKEIQKVQQQLMENFKCKNLGEVKYYLGMHVERDPDHRNAVLHGLNKHMCIKWHWLRKEVKRRTVNPIYIKTHQQPADFLAKRLADEPHWHCVRMSRMSMN
ncbi:unnamed protein product [Closterium sp. Naga37s-1]|nr:unnamed protein product [Closterium sp. Naga37s-1]